MKVSSNPYYVATPVLSLYGVLIIVTLVARLDKLYMHNIMIIIDINRLDMYNITFYGCKYIIESNHNNLTHNLTQSLFFDGDSDHNNASVSHSNLSPVKKILIIAYPR